MSYISQTSIAFTTDVFVCLSTLLQAKSRFTFAGRLIRATAAAIFVCSADFFSPTFSGCTVQRIHADAPAVGRNSATATHDAASYDDRSPAAAANDAASSWRNRDAAASDDGIFDNAAGVGDDGATDGAVAACDDGSASDYDATRNDGTVINDATYVTGCRCGPVGFKFQTSHADRQY